MARSDGAVIPPGSATGDGTSTGRCPATGCHLLALHLPLHSLQPSPLPGKLLEYIALHSHGNWHATSGAVSAAYLFLALRRGCSCDRGDNPERSRRRSPPPPGRATSPGAAAKGCSEDLLPNSIFPEACPGGLSRFKQHVRLCEMPAKRGLFFFSNYRARGRDRWLEFQRLGMAGGQGGWLSHSGFYVAAHHRILRPLS